MGEKVRGARPFAARVKCPHPDCSHMGEIITKAHCRIHHNIEREDLFSTYGGPIEVAYDGRLRGLNSKIKTIYTDNAPVTTGQKKGVRRR